MSTFLIIMAVSFLIIAIAFAIGILIPWFKEMKFLSTWEKIKGCLNVLAVLTVGAGLATLFFQVSFMIR